MTTHPRARLLLGIIVLIALLLRLVYSLSQPSGLIAPDEADYLRAANDLAENLSFFQTVWHHVPPVTPVLYSPVVYLFGMDYPAIRIFQSLLSPVLVLILFMLGREAGGTAVGLCVSALGAVYPYFVYFTGFALSENFAIMVVPAMLLFGLRSIKTRRNIDAALFGLSIAVAALTRAAVVDFVLLVPFVFVIGWGPKPKECLRATVLSVAGFAAIYVPWIGVNYRYFGEVMLAPTTGSGVMLYQTALKMEIQDQDERERILKNDVLPVFYNPVGSTLPERLEGDKWLRREGVKIIKRNSSQYPRIVFQNFKRFWQFYPHSAGGPDSAEGRRYRYIGLISYGMIFPFFLFGLVICIERLRELNILYLFLVYFTAIHVVLYGKLRYRIPMDSLIIVFAVLGLASAAQKWCPIFWGRVFEPLDSKSAAFSTKVSA